MGEQLMNDRLGRVPRLRLPPGVSILSRIGEGSPYDRFQQALGREGRLLADRSPAMMKWRLADPDLTTPPLLLAFRRGDVITGYAMAQMAKSNIIEVPVLEIIDLEALAWDDEAIPALMKALTDAARPLGAAKVRMQVVSPQMLTRLGNWAQSAAREGGWGHCHIRFAEDAPVARAVVAHAVRFRLCDLPAAPAAGCQGRRTHPILGAGVVQPLARLTA